MFEKNFKGIPYQSITRPLMEAGWVFSSPGGHLGHTSKSNALVIITVTQLFICLDPKMVKEKRQSEEENKDEKEIMGWSILFRIPRIHFPGDWWIQSRFILCREI